MKTLKLNRTTRFFGSLFFCAFFANITFAQIVTEPAILERTAKVYKLQIKKIISKHYRLPNKKVGR